MREATSEQQTAILRHFAAGIPIKEIEFKVRGLDRPTIRRVVLDAGRSVVQARAMPFVLWRPRPPGERVADAKGALWAYVLSLPIGVPLAFVAMAHDGHRGIYSLGTGLGIILMINGPVTLLCWGLAGGIGQEDLRREIRDPAVFVKNLYFGVPRWIFLGLLWVIGKGLAFAITFVVVVAVWRLVFHH